ncbi:MAG: imidazoleglycerol-phosphate dehydratase HisB [Acidimicrobiales bacterium]
MNRSASRSRSTKETTVSVDVNLDGTGVTQVSTGLPFFDHMLTQLGRHGGFDLTVTAEGDLEVDAHHTVEDVGLALGACVSEALGEKVGVRRFASIDLPLDEALIAVALDLSGRPFLVYDVETAGVADSGALGTPGFHPQLAEEFWRAFVMKAGITMHVRMLSGRNAHHILEATFKAVARALREAMTVDGDVVPSTKGVL